jgi:hypothetical protein
MYRMAPHKFRVGEKVQLLAGQGVRFATVEVFEIVQQLPERDGEYQYKIKSLDEPHLKSGERIPVAQGVGGATSTAHLLYPQPPAPGRKQ